ncbi:hypothetical protein [Cohnella mopanensis]|uniref:hypothetical protein n=1 Tax=Cohnella mopanensis TaxID=2911966 RepID=UPI001EF8ABC1|nr:hypothetical protein [Cohnella mopanensis]
MKFAKIKKWSTVVIVAGALILLYGLSQYLLGSYSSDTPESVFWAITSRRIAFPICGLILIIVGVLNLKIIDGIEEEISEVRYEINKLRSKINV